MIARLSSLLPILLAAASLLAAEPAFAAPAPADAPSIGQALSIGESQVQTSEAVRIALILTLLALIPAMAICMTPFIRIVVVLSMIRHAFGMPETPPNQVLVSLAIFLTAFTMMPALTAVNTKALQPFLNGQVTMQQAMDRGAEPMRAFMLRQVRDQDIKTIYDISKQPLPSRAADV